MNKTTISIVTILLALTATNIHACELEPHGFVRVGAGWSGDLNNITTTHNNSDDLAAQLELGIRWPLDEQHSIDFKLTHHSFWFVGKPFNDDDEVTSEHINIGYEFRW